ncbi:5-oxoprolinase subunit PxpB [Paenibacillus sepulcri]|uniref:5-oxoprolinase subunit PxpB n=2 Tax=Paenibacillus sepulcri TaxID=359917 RepID=A0ABS7C521_9BACL|nr:5-oxoprolinase subunit PxpB [Paenibacillus sepulcri]
MNSGLTPSGEVKIVPLGDSGLIVKLGDVISLETHKRVRQLSDYLERHPFNGLIEYVPAFTSVTIYYEGLTLMTEYADEVGQEDRDFPFQIAAALMNNIILQLKDISDEPERIVNIPVCYGGDLGPDLDAVADHNGLLPEEVISIHTSADYLVYMLGFAPGFAYLGGMSERIATPRRSTPRLSIPVGTVGIAGDQTGVYPIETPGGWQLIGRTPTRLFLPELMPPTLLKAGDIVRFYPIPRMEFDQWEEHKS